MLEDYVERYVDAVVSRNTKEMKRIERDLNKVGMDKYTLVVLAREEYKRRKEETK